MIVIAQDDGAGTGGGGSDPYVVGGNRGSGSPKIHHDVGVLPAHLVIHAQLLDDRIGEELSEDLLVAVALATKQEPDPQLAQHDRRQADPIRPGR